MNKRLLGRVLLFLALMFVISLAWDDHLHTEEDLRRPNDFGSYQGYGYYKIDPEAILLSLKNGDSNVFQPLLNDPNEIEEIPNISISWTQADFMSIFSTLSKFVWDDSMDPQVWSIYDIDFSGGCIDESCDLFHNAQIVYFKEIGNSYTTRIMDIQPYFGLVRWGDGASYPQPILRKWKGVELAMSKVTAEDALELAEANGGREKRLKEHDRCPVYVGSSRFDSENWNVLCLSGYTFLINLYTGETKLYEH